MTETTNEDSATGAAAQMGIGSSMSGPFGTALIEAASRRDNIVAMSADLKKFTDLMEFAALFPDRYLEVGMAEQSLMMAAAGAASTGLTVVATTFGAFLNRRAADFAVIQIALPRRDVKIIGAVPGITASFGPSHTSIEDVGYWRSIPNMTVIDPVDPIECAEALAVVLDTPGPVYLRQPFNRVASTRDEGRTIPGFELGKAHIIREGGDIAIISAGDRLFDALDAADALATESIQATVVHSSTLKPFDTTTVATIAERFGRVVTIENHTVYNGLFSAVSEVIARNGLACRVIPVAVDDEFPMFGSPDYVAGQLGLTADAVARAARDLIERRPLVLDRPSEI
jgi:transketolase